MPHYGQYAVNNINIYRRCFRGTFTGNQPFLMFLCVLCCEFFKMRAFIYHMFHKYFISIQRFKTDSALKHMPLIRSNTSFKSSVILVNSIFAYLPKNPNDSPVLKRSSFPFVAILKQKLRKLQAFLKSGKNHE